MQLDANLKTTKIQTLKSLADEQTIRAKKQKELRCKSVYCSADC